MFIHKALERPGREHSLRAMSRDKPRRPWTLAHAGCQQNRLRCDGSYSSGGGEIELSWILVRRHGIPACDCGVCKNFYSRVLSDLTIFASVGWTRQHPVQVSKPKPDVPAHARDPARLRFAFCDNHIVYAKFFQFQ